MLTTEEALEMLASVHEGIQGIQSILAGGVVTPAAVDKAINDRVEPLEKRVTHLERSRWVWLAAGLAIGIGIGLVF